MNVIDIFSGCGGLSYGFQNAEYNVLLGIDNDRAALNTFKINHTNSATLEKDLALISKDDILQVIGNKSVDVIIGGPPCQGMSISGPRKLDDPRNKLYLSFVEMVKMFRPKAFVLENVPGMASLYKGRIKDAVLKKFNELNYNVSWQILHAVDYGIPQTRRRLFFIGLLEGEFHFPVPKILSEVITCEDAIGDLPSLECDLGIDPMPYPNGVNYSEYQLKMKGNSKMLHNHLGTAHKEQTKKIIALVPEGGNYKDLPDKYRNVRNFNVAFTRYHSKKPANTIDTGHRHHFHYKYNRVLTVRENARLQSFPDTFIFTGNKSEQYRQVGNAVPPLLAQEIAVMLRNYL